MANVKTNVSTNYGKNVPGELGQPGTIGPLANLKMKIDPMQGEISSGNNRIKPGSGTNDLTKGK
jgi:hypothetical protein